MATLPRTACASESRGLSCKACSAASLALGLASRGRNVRFYLQDVGKFARERVGPQMGLIADLNQLHVNDHLFTGALHAAFEHIFHIEQAADFRNGLPGDNS